jgi:hypothetical protein
VDLLSFVRAGFFIFPENESCCVRWTSPSTQLKHLSLYPHNRAENASPFSLQVPAYGYQKKKKNALVSS